MQWVNSDVLGALADVRYYPDSDRTFHPPIRLRVPKSRINKPPMRSDLQSMRRTGGCWRSIETPNGTTSFGCIAVFGGRFADQRVTALCSRNTKPRAHR